MQQDEMPLPLLRESPVEDRDSSALLNEDKWDFVLVSDVHDENSKKNYKRKKFLKELRKKDFTIEEKKDEEKLFHGVRAPKHILDKYHHLHKKASRKKPTSGDSEDVEETARIRIVNFIVHNIEVPHSDHEKLRDLIKKKVFEAAFPLHQKEEIKKILNEEWARWGVLFKKQPIDAIRGYFGEKVALYFAWLGWYTYLLVFAALAGLVTIVAGTTVFSSSQVSKEICDANTTIMCPLCDQNCSFWVLSDTCTYAKVTHMIDNEATVAFAIFMAIWATVFLELWKRERANVVTKWKLHKWDDDEEELALQLINDFDHKPQKYKHSYIRSTIILILALLLILVLIGVAHMLVIYRAVATALLMQSKVNLLSKHANTVAVMTGAVLHYITIIIMTKVNRCVAFYLCQLENPRTFSQEENSFAVKIFIFQFFTNFSSLIYVAFFLGRINGHPGHYARIAGRWRLEECHPSGCITDLFIQMAIIMVLKQTISNIMEYLIPLISHQLRKKSRSPKKTSGEEAKPEDSCSRQWRNNYELNETHMFSLFDEYLEMVIQYSFTTIFVAAFPLAPLLALLNNIIEIHLDAIKMMRLHRRMVPRKAKDIGIWLQVLEAIGILAVIGNGLVIAITSDFIPVQVYKYMYSPCTRENHTSMDCSTGYINHSLSVFRIQDFEDHTNVLPEFNGHQIKECRYRDYRSVDDYTYTTQFWHVFAARLAFLILFEHVALCVKLIAAWYIPDVPQRVKNYILEEKFQKLRSQLSDMGRSPAAPRDTDPQEPLQCESTPTSRSPPNTASTAMEYITQV